MFFHLFIQHTFIDRQNVRGMGAGDSKVSEANSLDRVDGQVNRDNGHIVQKQRGPQEKEPFVPSDGLRKKMNFLAKP